MTTPTGTAPSATRAPSAASPPSVAPAPSATPPDLRYGEVEEEVRASVRALLTDRCDAASVLARVETDEPYDAATWEALASETGFAGLLVPERRGGAGASAREAAVVCEELGRAVAPVPYLGSAVLATTALHAAVAQGDDAGADLLRALASGRRTGALATPLAAPTPAMPVGVTAADGRLTGRVTRVADLEAADVALVPATDEDGPALYAVDLPVRGSEDGLVAAVPPVGVTVTPVTPLDLTRRIADLELAGAAGRRVASGEAARTAYARAWTTGAGLLTSEMLGVAEWCLDTTVAYVAERHQFGRPVGSFQAVKHRLADLWAEVSTARATARAAADALATESPDTDVLVAVAQATVSDTVVLAAEEAVQLHGGVAMTWEHPAHLYLGRAKSSQLALGTPERHRARLARAVDLPPPDAGDAPTS